MRPGAHRQAYMFPLAQLAAALSTGVLLSLQFPLPLKITLVGAGISTTIAWLFVIGRLRTLATLIITIGFLFLGMTLATVESQSIATNRIKRLIDTGELTNSQAVEVTGVLEREPEVAADRCFLYLRVERVRAKGIERDASGLVALLISVTARTDDGLTKLELRYGARLRVMTVLDRSDKFRNPGVSTFSEYLERRGYDAVGIIKSPLLIERLDDETVFLPLAWIYAWRRTLQNEIDSHFPNETGGILDAALLGNRYNLSNATSERFKQGGTFHVLVISGLHIAFLGSLVFVIVRRFTKSKLFQFLISDIVVWGYALAVGAESSVVRAALMFTVVLLAPLLFRRAVSLNALGGVAIVLLVWRPSDLLDPSFQLTFASVLAILIFAWPLLEKLSAVGGWRPRRVTPYPPLCASWFRSLSECLFWSTRKGKRAI